MLCTGATIKTWLTPGFHPISWRTIVSPSIGEDGKVNVISLPAAVLTEIASPDFN